MSNQKQTVYFCVLKCTLKIHGGERGEEKEEELPDTVFNNFIKPDANDIVEDVDTKDVGAKDIVEDVDTKDVDTKDIVEDVDTKDVGAKDIVEDVDAKDVGAKDIVEDVDTKDVDTKDDYTADDKGSVVIDEDNKIANNDTSIASIMDDDNTIFEWSMTNIINPVNPEVSLSEALNTWTGDNELFATICFLRTNTKPTNNEYCIDIKENLYLCADINLSYKYYADKQDQYNLVFVNEFFQTKGGSKSTVYNLRRLARSEQNKQNYYVYI
jgi:hypothetical protein